MVQADIGGLNPFFVAFQPVVRVPLFCEGRMAKSLQIVVSDTSMCQKNGRSGVEYVY